MTRQRILVVEDDGAIRLGVVDALQFAGFRVLEASRGDSGLEMALNASYNLLLLDVILPALSGLEILEQVRVERPTVPIIMLTARGEEADRVQGLRLGADDYVVKPFSVKELVARVDAVLRRSPERPAELTEVPIPGGVANLERREVAFDDGHSVDLSEREVDILRYLAGHSNRVITRDELMQRVWRINPRGVQTRTIDMHVARLRDKLRDDSSQPQLIVTVRGKGYMFAVNEAVS